MIGEKEDTIFISSTPRISGYFMNFIISDFLNENSNVKFQFNQQPVKDIVNDLVTGKIDICFYDSKDLNENTQYIESISIKKQEYVLIVPKKHKFAQEKKFL